MQEMLAYTITAVALYFISDKLLNWIEARRGKRFENRTLIFFGIIMLLALVSFEILQRLLTR